MFWQALVECNQFYIYHRISSHSTFFCMYSLLYDHRYLLLSYKDILWIDLQPPSDHRIYIYLNKIIIVLTTIMKFFNNLLTEWCHKYMIHYYMSREGQGDSQFRIQVFIRPNIHFYYHI